MGNILSNIQSISVKITSKLGIQTDVTQFFTLINIYQSLLTRKFISGRIVLADTSDLISNLPIIGNESVLITIQNDADNSTLQYNFKIYKIDRDTNTFHATQKIKILNIYLYTSEEFKNYTKISKRFQGTGSSIIQDLLTNNLSTSKTFDSVADTSDIDFVSNFWNFDKCIDYICNNSSGQYFDYVFYETNTGYNFKPLSYLFSQTNQSILKFDLATEQFANVDNILQYQFNSYFDDLMWRKKGMFGSTGHKIDFDLYDINFSAEDISDIDAQIASNGRNRMYNSERDVLNRVYVTYDDVEVGLVRTTHLNFLNRYNFTCNFNVDFDRNVGDMYRIDFPSLDNESVSGSDSFSGNWIATEINTSIFQTNEVKQNISFAKNALFNNSKLDQE